MPVPYMWSRMTLNRNASLRRIIGYERQTFVRSRLLPFVGTAQLQGIRLYAVCLYPRHESVGCSSAPPSSLACLAPFSVGRRKAVARTLSGILASTSLRPTVAFFTSVLRLTVVLLLSGCLCHRSRSALARQRSTLRYDIFGYLSSNENDLSLF